jgi:hypothetical protein
MWQSHFHVYTAVAIISQAQLLTAMSLNASMENTKLSPAPADSYFREHTASNLLYAHIAFMLLSWIGALPICTRYLMRAKVQEC